MLSRRSRLSLAQLLSTQPHPDLRVLFEKYHLPPFDEQPSALDSLARVLGVADEVACVHVLEEVGRTCGAMRKNLKPTYVWDQRFEDLVRCVILDGYRFDQRAWNEYELKRIEPVVGGAAAAEDDLSAALSASGLPKTQDVKALLSQSADAFTRAQPDFNACLSNARAALQTLATDIAKARAGAGPLPFDETKWGAVLIYLRTSGLITEDEEAGLSGVFRFDSPGAHKYVGITEQEAARLGRGFAVSMCYFLVKKHNG